jgi:hypothetical protein
MKHSGNLMIPLNQLRPRVLEWLWVGRLALGKLAIFDGDPGRGKSLVTLDLCARITTGRPMPDGSGGGEPANVVIIQGEDFADDTILPRLKALGADLGRVFVFHSDFLEEKGPFRLPTHTKILRQALELIRPRLLVIDPIMAFLDRKILACDDQSIRRALKPLGELVNHYGCACILVRHLNKSGGSRSLYRGGGSIGFSAACRSCWLFDFDPEDQGRLIMAQTKNNLAARQESFAYRIVPQLGAEPLLEWLGPSPLTSDELLGHAGRKAATVLLRDVADEFLTALLEDGPRTTTEIWQAAREQGLHRRTLQNARSLLGIDSVRVWNGQKTLTYWLLPGQKLPDTIPPEHRPEDIDDLFAGVREKYPLDPLEEDE